MSYKLSKVKIWLKISFYHAAWAPITIFIFYAIAAKVFNAYLIYPWLDIPTHFCGGMAITYFFLVTVSYSQLLVGQIPNIIQSLLCLGLTAIMAVIWEFLEFLSDITFNTQMNLGVSDTLSDLFFGLFGGFLIIVIKIRK